MEDDRFLSQVAQSIEAAFRPKSSTELTQAHENLESLLPQDERFMASLLLIAVEGRGLQGGINDFEARKAASIVLKKEIDSSWKPSFKKMNCQTENAKSMVRDNILEGLLKCGSIEIASFLGQCVSSIIARDYPQQWPSYEEAIHRIFSEKNKEKSYIGLLCLHCLGRVRKYFIGRDRDAVEKTVETFLPVLVKQASALVTALNNYPKVESSDYSTAHIFLKNIHVVMLVDTC